MRERRRIVSVCLLAGALLGAAFLAKYTAVLLVPTTFLYLAFSSPSRRWLRRPSLYVGGLIALAIALPVLLWNQAHGWPTLRLHFVERANVGVPVAGENAINHMMEDASSSGTSTLQSLTRLLVGQVLSYSPLLAPALVFALVRSLRRARHDDRDLFLSAFSWPVLGLVLVAMLRVKDAEQHWTMVAFIPAAIAAGRYADEAWATARRFSYVTALGVALSFVGFGVGVVATHSDALVRLLAPAHYDPRADLSNEMAGWDQVRASVARAAHAASGNVVLASNGLACDVRATADGDGGRAERLLPDRPALGVRLLRPPESARGRHRHRAHERHLRPELPADLEGRSCVVSDRKSGRRAGRASRRPLCVVHSCPSIQAPPEKRASRD